MTRGEKLLHYDAECFHILTRLDLKKAPYCKKHRTKIKDFLLWSTRNLPLSSSSLHERIGTRTQTQEQAEYAWVDPAIIHDDLSSIMGGWCGLRQVGEGHAGQQSARVSSCFTGAVPPLKGLSDLLLVRNQCHVIVPLAALDGPPCPRERREQPPPRDDARMCSQNVHPRQVIDNVFYVKVRKHCQSLVCHFSGTYSEMGKCSKEWQKLNKLNWERHGVRSSRQPSPVRLSQRSGTLCRVCMCLLDFTIKHESTHTL